MLKTTIFTAVLTFCTVLPNVLTAIPMVDQKFPIDMNVPKAKPLDTHGLYKEVDPIQLSKRELNCLRKNVFYEAGVEDYYGKIAVAQVTYNRLKAGKWGKSICKVVYARKQFSWTAKESKLGKPKGQLWKRSIKAVNDFISGTRIISLKDSLYFHTDYIKTPAWVNDQLKHDTQIGRHIFYSYRP